MMSLGRFLAVARKPINVVAFRLRQEIALYWLRLTGYWKRLERASIAKSQEADIAKLLDDIADRIPWSPPGPDQADVLCTQVFNGRSLAQVVARINDGRITVFGRDVTIPSGPDWHRDRVHDKCWSPRYVRQYEFYEARNRPYDVKRVWEPSRLGFLLPLALSCALNQDQKRLGLCLSQIVEVLDDWRTSNPVAYSVNWYPMEASVRLINLVLVMAALAFAPRVPERDQAARRVLTLLLSHVEFVARNLEYTDIRGNHYAANIVALALGAAVLKHETLRMSRLKAFAIAEMEREIPLQFLSDGVNIEKSLPYHQFVLELFLVGAAAAEWSGTGLGDVSRLRLENAGELLARARRPDGLIPVIGDNDSARILAMEIEPSRSPDGLLTLLCAFSGRGPGFPVSETFPGALVRLNSSMKHAVPDDGCEGIAIFAEGGFATASAPEAHLVVDFGEIGLHGRGGHSHNDLLSFELSLGGQALIVDRGCPTYTGDLAMRDEYRSSRSHNTLCLDDAEHARLLGPWSMENRASARLARHASGGDYHEIVLENRTFLDHDPPVTHSRTLRLARDGRAFQCVDDVDPGGARRRIVRYFHFSPESRSRLGGTEPEIAVRLGGALIYLEVDRIGEWAWVRRDVSNGYDEISEAYALRVVAEISQPVALRFEARLVVSA